MYLVKGGSGGSEDAAAEERECKATVAQCQPGITRQHPVFVGEIICDISISM